MARYRKALPQMACESLFLTDGGLETDLIFNEGFDLPLFASFPLTENAKGLAALRQYYLRFGQAAKDAGAGFILEAATWRANRDWGTQLGYTGESLAEANRLAVGLLVELREELGEKSGPVVISAAIGPRGDAYSPETLMTPDEAQDYHSEQIATLADTETDLVTALTITHAAEAIGIVRAAQAAEMPVVISFTVGIDGALPDGSLLSVAVAEVDGSTFAGPVYYGINCAHPTHFESVLVAEEDLAQRIQMIRANASRMSHAELDEAAELDDGDPDEFGLQNAKLRNDFPRINVLGGCCGTDVRHVQAIARALR